MKMLDRYIIRSFLASAALWFAVMIALRVIVDLFVNMDEFTEADVGFQQVALYMFSYYRYQSLVYFAELGGLIIVVAAMFTLARMNHTNELTAMLASGVNLHRVVWPIVCSAIILGSLVIIDREILIPAVSSKLVRKRDDRPGAREFAVGLIPDSSGSVWFSPRFKQANNQMELPVIVLRDKQHRAVGQIDGHSAKPDRLDGKAGWTVRKAYLTRITHDTTAWLYMPDYKQIWTRLSPTKLLTEAKKLIEKTGGAITLSDDEVREVSDMPPISDPHYDMALQFDRLDMGPSRGGSLRGGRLINPRFAFTTNDGASLGTFLADSAVWREPRPKEGYWELTNGRLFYPSDLTTNYLALRQTSRWLNYMSTAQLTRLLKLRQVHAAEVLLTKHTRFTDPINNFIMLLLALPFVLSRERTIKASASGCMLLVGVFYLSVYLCRYVDIPPEWAAWLPILTFGPVAVVMVDSIKT